MVMSTSIKLKPSINQYPKYMVKINLEDFDHLTSAKIMGIRIKKILKLCLEEIAEIDCRIATAKKIHQPVDPKDLELKDILEKKIVKITKDYKVNL